MHSCLTTPTQGRIDARSYLFNTVQADFRPAIVNINQEKLRALDIPKKELKPMSSGLAGTAPGSNLTTGIAYLLLLNSQNFQFWDMVDGKFVRYAYEDVVGAMGMRRAFHKAWGDDATLKTIRSRLSTSSVESLFGAISQPAARAQIFAEMLNADWLEAAAAAIEIHARKVGKFTLEESRYVADIFPRSYAEPYLKRAQLALLGIAGFCSESGIEVDCSQLTLCADYQLPRMLRAMGVLEYSPELAQKVDSQTLIEKDSIEERAIRAATIVAGEMMAEHFGVTPAAVDNFLWTNRSKAGSAPFHLTITTDY